MYYDPSCFNVTSLAQAKQVILTPEDSDTETRWVNETAYVTRLIGEYIPLHPTHRVLDYGCGVGRMAKALIGVYGCSVIGVDFSASMRALAAAYVENERFLACAGGQLLDSGIVECHHAIIVWTLQHILAVEAAIDSIERKLHKDGRIFVLNNICRCLPTSDGNWVDDKKDVREMLRGRFQEIAGGVMDPAATTLDTSKCSFWAVYQRRN